MSISRPARQQQLTISRSVIFGTAVLEEIASPLIDDVVMMLVPSEDTFSELHLLESSQRP